jgi:hypothetical protein
VARRREFRADNAKDPSAEGSVKKQAILIEKRF